MKITAIWKFILWSFSIGIGYLVLDLITGAQTPTVSVESILIMGFAITWALDKDRELDK